MECSESILSCSLYWGPNRAHSVWAMKSSPTFPEDPVPSLCPMLEAPPALASLLSNMGSRLPSPILYVTCPGWPEEPSQAVTHRKKFHLSFDESRRKKKEK